MWPVQTVSDLADFSGRPETSYTGFAASALLQATILFTTITENGADDYPSMATDDQFLANEGILAYADWTYLRWPFQQMIANPAMSENIGGYSYSKPPPLQVRNVQAQELSVITTGIVLWDTAVQFLSKRTRANGVFFGQVEGLEHAKYDDQVRLLRRDEEGNLALLGPADFNQLDFPSGFVVNAPVFPSDPGF